MKNKNNITRKIVLIGVLSALGIVLNFIQIPYLLVPYLKFDLSEIVVLIGMMFSFTVGIGVVFSKAIIFSLLNPIDPIGNLAMMIGSTIIALSFYVLHKKLKIKSIKTLIAVTIIFTILMTVLNFFFITPAYMGQSFEQMQKTDNYLAIIIFTYVPFNIFKMLIISFVFNIINKKVLLQIRKK